METQSYPECSCTGSRITACRGRSRDQLRPALREENPDWDSKRVCVGVCVKKGWPN